MGPVGPAGPSTGPAGGALTGSFPNPQLAAGAISSPAAFAPGAVPFLKATVGLTSTASIVLAASIARGGLAVTSGDRVVVTVPGVYRIDGSIAANNLVQGEHLFYSPTLNGNYIVGNDRAPAIVGDPTIARFSAVEELAVGDAIGVGLAKVSSGQWSNFATASDVGNGFLTIQWISP